jgi:hypothetical protein
MNETLAKLNTTADVVTLTRCWCASTSSDELRRRNGRCTFTVATKLTALGHLIQYSSLRFSWTGSGTPYLLPEAPSPTLRTPSSTTGISTREHSAAALQRRSWGSGRSRYHVWFVLLQLTQDRNTRICCYRSPAYSPRRYGTIGIRCVFDNPPTHPLQKTNTPQP